jgi:hypothetical protein
MKKGIIRPKYISIGAEIEEKNYLKQKKVFSLSNKKTNLFILFVIAIGVVIFLSTRSNDNEASIDATKAPTTPTVAPSKSPSNPTASPTSASPTAPTGSPTSASPIASPTTAPVAPTASPTTLLNNRCRRYPQTYIFEDRNDGNDNCKIIQNNNKNYHESITSTNMCNTLCLNTPECKYANYKPDINMVNKCYLYKGISNCHLTKNNAGGEGSYCDCYHGFGSEYKYDPTTGDCDKIGTYTTIDASYLDKPLECRKTCLKHPDCIYTNYNTVDNKCFMFKGVCNLIQNTVANIESSYCKQSPEIPDAQTNWCNEINTQIEQCDNTSDNECWFTQYKECAKLPFCSVYKIDQFKKEINNYQCKPKCKYSGDRTTCLNKYYCTWNDNDNSCGNLCEFFYDVNNIQGIQLPNVDISCTNVDNLYKSENTCRSNSADSDCDTVCESERYQNDPVACRRALSSSGIRLCTHHVLGTIIQNACYKTCSLRTDQDKCSTSEYCEWVASQCRQICSEVINQENCNIYSEHCKWENSKCVNN